MAGIERESDSESRGVTWRLARAGNKGVAAWDDKLALEVLDATGATLAGVHLPFEKMDELFRPHLAIFAELHLDGTVSMMAEFFAIMPPPTDTDVLALVERALEPEMLQDEPNAKEQLAKLRQRLTEALVLVDQTLSNLNKPIP